MIFMEFHVFAISMILWLHDMLETIGAGVHPFYEKLVILMETHGFSPNPVNSWGNGGICIKYRYSHPHG